MMVMLMVLVALLLSIRVLIYHFFDMVAFLSFSMGFESLFSLWPVLASVDMFGPRVRSIFDVSRGSLLLNRQRFLIFVLFLAFALVLMLSQSLVQKVLEVAYLFLFGLSLLLKGNIRESSRHVLVASCLVWVIDAIQLSVRFSAMTATAFHS